MLSLLFVLSIVDGGYFFIGDVYGGVYAHVGVAFVLLSMLMVCVLMLRCYDGVDMVGVMKVVVVGGNVVVVVVLCVCCRRWLV